MFCENFKKTLVFNLPEFEERPSRRGPKGVFDLAKMKSLWTLVALEKYKPGL